MSAIQLNSTQIAQLFQNHSAAIVTFLINRVACPELIRILKLQVRISLLQRQTRLVQGEALFNVSHESLRSFTVH